MQHNIAYSCLTPYLIKMSPAPTVYDGEIPGNLLGFNLWPGCSFSGTVSNTTTVSGLNALQVTNLIASQKPNCADQNGVATFSITLPFTVFMDAPLAFKLSESYSGTWCDIPGFDTTYLTASGSLAGLAMSGNMTVAGEREYLCCVRPL